MIVGVRYCLSQSSLVTNDASFGMLPYIIRRYPIWFTDVLISSAILIFLFYQPSVEAISCVQKCKKHFNQLSAFVSIE